MKYVVLVLCLTGCTMSFQPFPSVSRAEWEKANSELLENDKMLAEAMSKLSPKVEEKKVK